MFGYTNMAMNRSLEAKNRHTYKPSECLVLGTRVSTDSDEIVHCTLCRRNGRSLGTRYGPGEGQIWLDDLQCRGFETQLGNCRHAGWGYHNCRHHEDVSITCNNDTSSGGLDNLCLQVCIISTQNSDNNGIFFQHFVLRHLKIITLN